MVRGAGRLRAVVMALLLACGGVVAAERAAAARPQAAAGVTRATVFWSVVDLFRDFYWDPDHLDWDEWAGRHVDAAVAAERRSVFDSVMRRMVAEVDDDHSRWLGLGGPPGEPAAGPGDDA